MTVAKLEGYASAQAITGRFALRVEVSLQVGNAVHRAVHRLKVDLQHTAVAREEAPGPVLALDPGVQDVADRRVADQRGLRVVRAGIIEQYAVDAFWRAGPASVRGERPSADARTFGGHGARAARGRSPAGPSSTASLANTTEIMPTVVMAAVTIWERQFSHPVGTPKDRRSTW